MRLEEGPVAGMFLVGLEPLSDERGWFARSFCAEEFARAGLASSFVQGNVSRTRRAGTVRGLHYQLPPAAEDKYVRCTRGALFDVGVDVRVGSPTFGRWWGVELGADDGRGLFLPTGVAHGFQTLADDTEAAYLVSAPYTPTLERGLRHDDPAVGIDWPLAVVDLSDKDRGWPGLDGIEPVVLAAAGERGP